MARGMRLVLGALLLAATGCPGEPIFHHCPADETCSPVTDGNLVFHGTLAASGRAGILYPTAIGGTQDISLELSGEPFTRPYEVDDTTGAAVAFDSSEGAVLHLHGVAKGTNMLRVVDPISKELFGRVQLEAADIGEIYLGSAQNTAIDNNNGVVYLAGHEQMIVSLNFDPYLVVDTSMLVTADGATRTAWDRLEYADLAPGPHEVTVTAADHEPMTLPFEVVAAADTIEPSPEITFIAGFQSSFGFYARNAGRTVVGAEWSFTTDNGTIEAAGCVNCVYITPATAGTMHITASAAGATFAATYPVRAMP
jgi:hypothetical protein